MGVTPVKGREVVLTILTGMRPERLEETLSSLQKTSPGLMDEAFVSVLHNTGDGDTGGILRRYRVDDLVKTDRLIGIGEAVSKLHRRALRSKRPYWLHLEDDWRCLPTHPRWLDDAKAILNWGVAEVRLRHIGEPLTGNHRVTGDPIEWEDMGWWRLGRCHVSFTPALRMTERTRFIFPCQNEEDAQKRAHQNSLTQVAQLVPGVFVHTGYEKSLRATEGNP